MNKARIAIPSTLPGGLQAQVGAHFGHCDIYTVVDVEDNLIAQVGLLPPVPHEQGGCLAAVNHLAQAGVNVLIAGGLGMRPSWGSTRPASRSTAGRPPPVWKPRSRP